MKKVQKIVKAIYTELFAKSDPPLDYNELLNSSDEVKKAFDFNDHYLPMEEYQEIVEKHLSNVKLPGYLKEGIKFEMMMGRGPSSARKEDRV
jgi:hypothetical protein